MNRTAFALLACLALAIAPAHAWARAQPKANSPAPPPSVLGDAPLAPGTFAWQPELSPHGPVLLLIDLKQQQAYVYRNGVRIARSTVSTGKPGYETPTGVFSILQKQREHYSNRYDNAPMPFMQRLTWSGVALHAGHLPGYPASHGCVRLPYAFSERLFGITATGATVVIRDGLEEPRQTSNAPFGSEATAPAGTDSDDWTWNPERSPAGPVTIVLSTRDSVAVVLRNAIEIGRAKVRVESPVAGQAQVFMLLSGHADRPSRIVPGRPALNWLQVGGDSRPGPLSTELVSNVEVPALFAQGVYDALEPGSTVVLTPESLSTGSSGAPLTILRADELDPAAAATPADSR
jgi:hypothetical protein